MIDTDKRLKAVKHIFEDYIKLFYNQNPDNDKNILLKHNHSFRVYAEMQELVKNENLTKNLTTLALTAALLHDMGRFKQYSKYKTFVDKNSKDHAELGIQAILETNILKDFNEKEQNIILNAVKYHNKATIPNNLDNESTIISKMVRDADKLDIWFVLTNYYKSNEKNKAIELGLPDSPYISTEVLNDIDKQETVKAFNIKTLNDFKILQMSWAYDLNYTSSLQKLNDKQYLKSIFNSINCCEKEVKPIYDKINDYLNKRLNKQIK